MRFIHIYRSLNESTNIREQTEEVREYTLFLESVLEELCEELNLDPQELKEDPSTLNNLYTMMSSSGGGHAIPGGLSAAITLIGVIASLVGAAGMSLPGLRALPKQALVGLLGKLKRFIVKVKSGKKLTTDEKEQARNTLASALKGKDTKSQSSSAAGSSSNAKSSGGAAGASSHKPGDVWKTSSGSWGAKNANGDYEYFDRDNRVAAERFARRRA